MVRIIEIFTRNGSFVGGKTEVEINQLMCRSKINCDIDVLIWGHNGGNIARFANNGQRPVIS